MAAERTSMRHVREVLRLKFPLPDDMTDVALEGRLFPEARTGDFVGIRRWALHRIEPGTARLVELSRLGDWKRGRRGSLRYPVRKE